jgi:hypothetical protein
MTTVLILWRDMAHFGPRVLGAMGPSHTNRIVGTQCMVPSDSLVVYVCETDCLAYDLVRHLMELKVERVIIAGAVHFLTRDNAVMSRNLNGLYDKPLKCKELPGETDIYDPFLAGMIHFMMVSEIPARLLLVRGHRLNPAINQDLPKEVEDLLHAIQQELNDFGLHLSYDSKKLKQFSPELTEERDSREQLLMYG